MRSRPWKPILDRSLSSFTLSVKPYDAKITLLLSLQPTPAFAFIVPLSQRLMVVNADQVWEAAICLRKRSSTPPMKHELLVVMTRSSGSK